MNSEQLMQLVVAAVNKAIGSGQTLPGQAILILETVKMDIHYNLRKSQEESKIVPANGKLPPFQEGGRG